MSDFFIMIVWKWYAQFNQVNWKNFLFSVHGLYDCICLVMFSTIWDLHWKALFQFYISNSSLHVCYNFSITFPLAAVWRTCHLFKNKLFRLTFFCVCFRRLILPQQLHQRTGATGHIVHITEMTGALAESSIWCPRKENRLHTEGCIFHPNQLLHISLMFT